MKSWAKYLVIFIVLLLGLYMLKPDIFTFAQNGLGVGVIINYADGSSATYEASNDIFHRLLNAKSIIDVQTGKVIQSIGFYVYVIATWEGEASHLDCEVDWAILGYSSEFAGQIVNEWRTIKSGTEDITIDLSKKQSGSKMRLFSKTITATELENWCQQNGIDKGEEFVLGFQIAKTSKFTMYFYGGNQQTLSLDKDVWATLRLLRDDPGKFTGIKVELSYNVFT